MTEGIRKVVENLHVKLPGNSVEASEKTDKELSAQPTISPLITPLIFKEEEIIIPTLKSEHPTPIDTSSILLNSQKSAPISPNQLLTQSTDATPPTAIPLIASSKDTDQPAISDDIAPPKVIEDTPQLESATLLLSTTLESPFALPRINFLYIQKQAPTEETVDHAPLTNPENFTFTGTFGEISWPICRVAISPDGKTLASASIEGKNTEFKLWNFYTGKVQYSYDEKDSGFGASGSFDWLDGWLESTNQRDYIFWKPRSQSNLFNLHDKYGFRSVVAVSPDGETLVSGNEDTTIKTWNLQDRNMLDIFRGHSKRVNSLAISPDGKTLISGSEDSTIKLWNMDNGKLLLTLEGHSDAVESVAITSDGQTLVSMGKDSTIMVWNLRHGNLSKSLERDAGPVYSVAISPDGQWLASGSRDKTIKIWGSENTPQQKAATLFSVTILERPIALPRITFLHTRRKALSSEALNHDPLTNLESIAFKGTFGEVSWPVCSVAISPDGKTLASASIEDGNIELKLWNLLTGEVQYPHSNIRKGWGTTSGAEGNIFDWLTLTSQGLEYPFKGLPSKQSSFELPSYYGLRNVVAMSPDGRILVSGNEDTTIKIWNLQDGNLLNILWGHAKGVNSLVISHDGRILVSGSEDATIRLWNIDNGELLFTLKEHAQAVECVAIIPNGQTLVSMGKDSTIMLWNLYDGKLLRSLERHAGAVYSLAFSPDGQWLASGSEDTTIKLWNLHNGKLLRSLEKHAAAVYSVDISPDGQTLVSGSSDRTIKVWRSK